MKPNSTLSVSQNIYVSHLFTTHKQKPTKKNLLIFHFALYQGSNHLRSLIRFCKGHKIKVFCTLDAIPCWHATVATVHFFPLGGNFWFQPDRPSNQQIHCFEEEVTITKLIIVMMFLQKSEKLMVWYGTVLVVLHFLQERQSIHSKSKNVCEFWFSVQ